VSDDAFRPLSDDPSGATIAEMFDAGADWLVTAPGDYTTGAAETMLRDGTGWQEVVMLDWPCRVNKTGEGKLLHLMMSPEDALGLAENIAHTAIWMIARRAER